MERHGFRSQVHHRKPQGRPMPPHIRRGNASRSSVRAGIEHVFAQQKGPMDLCIRTIGIVRAKVKIGLANLTYNIRRLVFQKDDALPCEPRAHAAEGFLTIPSSKPAITPPQKPSPSVRGTSASETRVGRGAQLAPSASP